MHRSLALLAPLLMFVLGLSPGLGAQTSLRLPGCEVNPGVQDAIDRNLDQKLLDSMTFADRMALERRTLEGLIAKYPRELEPYAKLREAFYPFSPQDWETLQEGWIRMGKEHPNDPLALLLESEALYRTDTPESIRLLQSARAIAPDFPWAARDLAVIYSAGKYEDLAKARENIDAFFAICPASSDPLANYWLSKADPSLQPKVGAAEAEALRAKLDKETDPRQLKGYSALWTLEFQIRNPQEYGAERTNIAQDLVRMEKIQPNGNAEWQALLLEGYRQSGAPQEKIAALEDRLIEEFPHSHQAYAIVSDRWEKAHPEPQDQNDAVAWNRYRKEYERALQAWISEFPDARYLQDRAWFRAIGDDNTIPEKDGIAAVDSFLRLTDIYDGPGWRSGDDLQAASLLLERGWEPDRAIDLLKQASSSFKDNLILSEKDDDLTDAQAQERLNEQLQARQDLDGLMLKAAIEADKPEFAAELRAAVEGPPPQQKNLLEGYWTNRARLAQLSGSKMDALAFYQLALQTRLENPRPFEGRVHDDLAEEAHALWKEQGGTETAWVAWSRMPVPDKTVLAAGLWEKPKESIPAFDLTDLSGRTWRLKELNGKTVLIDVWATWCAPCQMELSNLEKFYQQMKNRNDIQILTFASDSDPGLVGPFAKNKGYTFPILPITNVAAINDLTNEGIPQTWILNGSGRSVWRQLGYDPGTYDDFSRDMLVHLDAVPAKQ